MSCPTCTPCAPTDSGCVTVPPILAPCSCNDTPATREEGAPGEQGLIGETPVFTVGTVTEGSANVILTENTPTDYTVDFVIPQPPLDVANTWTAVQTFQATPVFESGIDVTGGATDIGGTGLTVTPGATFEANVGVGGDETVAGSVTVDGSVGITGTLSVASGTILNDLEVDGALSFGGAATLSLTTVTGFVKGAVVLDSCNKPKLVANHGSDYYSRQNGTTLTPVLAGTTGTVCDQFVATVPVSACAPQLTPVVRIVARIGYTMAAALPSGLLQFNLRQGSPTGASLDAFVQGTAAFDNTAAGCVILEGYATLAVGNTFFFVQVVNGTDQDLTPNLVTVWITN